LQLQEGVVLNGVGLKKRRRQFVQDLVRTSVCSICLERILFCNASSSIQSWTTDSGRT